MEIATFLPMAAWDFYIPCLQLADGLIFPDFSSHLANMNICAVGISFLWAFPVALTLIRAAEGVYDFRNFEQVYLHNDLSKKNFLINVFFKKRLGSIFC